MSTSNGLSVIGLLLLLVSAQAQAFDWKNLWSTPAQQAEQQLESAQYDELIEQAPDASWRGIGEYRKGDYEAAIKSFAEQRDAATLTGSANQMQQAIYNQANAHTLNESYPEAIALYGEVLALNPEHADAIHNRAIAEQLLEQQQQQQNSDSESQDGEQQDGEQSDGEQSDGEQSDGEQGEQSSADQQNSEQQQNNQQQDGDQQQSDDAQSGQGSTDDSEQSTDDAQSAEEQAQQKEQAAQAMQAERANNASDEADDEATSDVTTQGDMAPPNPLTEREQANEQWLRQIPDDPAGLLQRKLQNRHLTDFPQVKDSVNPW